VTQNQAEAVKWYQRAANKGHAAARLSLGNCYYLGQGVARNLTEAVKLYKKSAKQDFALAQVSLGNCYSRGEGVAKTWPKP
jgi:TPR repeat protein